ncbi:MAG: HlyD family type I secretion periplasmic adaptor subunit [Alphaproteobacteria bacterium]
MTPPYVVLYGSALIVGLLALVLVGSAVTPVITSANATGIVTPSGSVKPIQHLAGGSVAEVFVRNGAFVKEGQSLLRLRGDDDRERFDEVNAEYFAAVAEYEQLSALAHAQRPDFSALPVSQKAMGDAQRAVYSQTLKARSSQRAALKQSRRQAEARANALESKIDGLHDEYTLLYDEFKNYRSLLEKRYVTRVRYSEMRRELSRLQSSISQTMAELKAAQATIAETRARMTEFNSVERKKVVDRMGVVTATLAEVKETRERLRGSVDHLVIVAPRDGIVHSLAYRSPGSVITPGAVIAEIVPKDGSLIVEAKILPRDVGFLTQGQTARITVDGFNVAQYATLQGVLERVSATSLIDEQNGEPYFLANLEVDPATADNSALFSSLRPGLSVQVSIVTGESSLLRYLIQPVYDSLQNAFSER